VDCELFRDGFRDQCLNLEGAWDRSRGKISACPYEVKAFEAARDDRYLVELIRLHDVVVFPRMGL